MKWLGHYSYYKLNFLKAIWNISWLCKLSFLRVLHFICVMLLIVNYFAAVKVEV